MPAGNRNNTFIKRSLAVIVPCNPSQHLKLQQYMTQIICIITLLKGSYSNLIRIGWFVVFDRALTDSAMDVCPPEMSIYPNLA